MNFEEMLEQRDIKKTSKIRGSIQISFSSMMS